jgi:hypothetical protein
MKSISKYVWVGLLIIILLAVSGYFGYNAFSKRVVAKSNKEAAEKQKVIDQLEIEKKDILTERDDIKKRYEYLKNNPTVKIKKVPVVKYKTIEKIKYVESNKYEEAWRAWEDCDMKLTLCMDNYDDMNLNYKHYIDNCEKQKVELKNQVNIFRDARDLLAARNKSVYSVLKISALGIEGYMYHGEDKMPWWDNLNVPRTEITKAIRFDGIFYFLKLELSLFNKDIIRRDLFK